MANHHVVSMHTICCRAQRCRSGIKHHAHKAQPDGEMQGGDEVDCTEGTGGCGVSEYPVIISLENNCARCGMRVQQNNQ